MAAARRSPKTNTAVSLIQAAAGNEPIAIILADHNGSGKSTFWYDKLADHLQLPLVNADRLTLSILPPPDSDTQTLRPWAAALRDTDARLQRISQDGVSCSWD